jgi:hypothetical protein
MSENAPVIESASRTLVAAKDEITNIIVCYTGMYRPMAESITDEIVSFLEHDTFCSPRL